MVLPTEQTAVWTDGVGEHMETHGRTVPQNISEIQTFRASFQLRYFGLTCHPVSLSNLVHICPHQNTISVPNVWWPNIGTMV